MKLTNILKEIQIKTLNSVSPHNSNEGLCNFLNQNVQEFIKHENIDAWHENPDILKLKIVKNHSESGKTEIRWINQYDTVFAYVEVEAYHWLCPKENLPNPGSFAWVVTEFKDVKFWKLDDQSED